jgi:hypothetical protein
MGQLGAGKGASDGYCHRIVADSGNRKGDNGLSLTAVINSGSGLHIAVHQKIKLGLGINVHTIDGDNALQTKLTFLYLKTAHLGFGVVAGGGEGCNFSGSRVVDCINGDSTIAVVIIVNVVGIVGLVVVTGKETKTTISKKREKRRIETSVQNVEPKGVGDN